MTIYFDKMDICTGCRKANETYLCPPINLNNNKCPCHDCIIKTTCQVLCDNKTKFRLNSYKEIRDILGIKLSNHISWNGISYNKSIFIPYSLKTPSDAGYAFFIKEIMNHKRFKSFTYRVYNITKLNQNIIDKDIIFMSDFAKMVDQKGLWYKINEIK